MDDKGLVGGIPTVGKLAVVEWVDIVSCQRVPIPSKEDAAELELVKHTIGYIHEYEDRVVVISDYDVTNAGDEFQRNNDFTVIPRGVIRRIIYLTPTGTVRDVGKEGKISRG